VFSLERLLITSRGACVHAGDAVRIVLIMCVVGYTDDSAVKRQWHSRNIWQWFLLLYIQLYSPYIQPQ